MQAKTFALIIQSIVCCRRVALIGAGLEELQSNGQGLMIRLPPTLFNVGHGLQSHWPAGKEAVVKSKQLAKIRLTLLQNFAFGQIFALSALSSETKTAPIGNLPIFAHFVPLMESKVKKPTFRLGGCLICGFCCCFCCCCCHRRQRAFLLWQR